MAYKEFNDKRDTQVYGARLQVYLGGLVPCDRNADEERTETVHGVDHIDALHSALSHIAKQMGYELKRIQK